MIAPCRDCENKGCGSFHDRCGKYRAWVAKNVVKNALSAKKDREYVEILITHSKMRRNA